MLKGDSALVYRIICGGVQPVYCHFIAAYLDSYGRWKSHDHLLGTLRHLVKMGLIEQDLDEGHYRAVDPQDVVKQRLSRVS